MTPALPGVPDLASHGGHRSMLPWGFFNMMRPRPLPPIPEDTRRICEDLIEPSSLPCLLANEFSDILADEMFAPLYSNLGQPAYSPILLAFVTILQVSERLSDRKAAKMARLRIDWKYALHLALNDPGFDSSVLCEYRQRLVTHADQRLVLDEFLKRFDKLGLLKGRKTQRTDSTAIIGAARELNRLELVMETMRFVLEDILQIGFDWFRRHIPDEYIDRYEQWTQAEKLVRETGSVGDAKAKALMIETGQNGFALLDMLSGEDTPEAVLELESVAELKRIWKEQYRQGPRGVKPVQLPMENQLCEEMAALKCEIEKRERRLAEHKEETDDDLSTGDGENPSTEDNGDGKRADPSPDNVIPDSPMPDEVDTDEMPYEVTLSTAESRKADGIGITIVSPHDPDARYATKRGKSHTGFKLNITETATEDAPAIITDIGLEDAAAYDGSLVNPVLQRLNARGLLPDKLLADAGYTCGWTLKECNEFGVTLLGPVSPDSSGPTHKGEGFAAKDFDVDTDMQQARCPGGHLNSTRRVKERADQKGQMRITFEWTSKTCGACPFREQCVGAKQKYRALALSEDYPLIAARRKEQTTLEFWEEYRRRAGIEPTVLNFTHHKLGRITPYRGKAKSLLYYVFMAVGLDLERIGRWLTGTRPKRERNTVLGRYKAARDAAKNGTDGLNPVLVAY
jgi:transposase